MLNILAVGHLYVFSGKCLFRLFVYLLIGLSVLLLSCIVTSLCILDTNLLSVIRSTFPVFKPTHICILISYKICDWHFLFLSQKTLLLPGISRQSLCHFCAQIVSLPGDHLFFKISGRFHKCWASTGLSSDCCLYASANLSWPNSHPELPSNLCLQGLTSSIQRAVMREPKRSGSSTVIYWLNDLGQITLCSLDLNSSSVKQRLKRENIEPSARPKLDVVKGKELLKGFN